MWGSSRRTAANALEAGGGALESAGSDEKL